MRISKLPLIIAGCGALGALHLGFQPSANPSSPYREAIEEMREACLENPEEYQRLKLVSCGDLDAYLRKLENRTGGN